MNKINNSDALNRLNAWIDLYEVGGEIDNDDFSDLYEDLVLVRDAINGKSIIAKIDAVGYEDYVYAIVKADCDGMDSIYGDYIERLIGSSGLNALIKNDMVESCGVVNGRQLYVLR